VRDILSGLGVLLLGGTVWCAEPVNFLVGPIGGIPSVGRSNSYILPLTRAEDIDTARRHAAATDPRVGTIAPVLGIADLAPIVRIELGSDCINRDLFAPGEPFWSWHVVDLVGWTGAFIPTYPYYDPWQLERDVQAGTITNGFEVSFADGYMVIAELTSTYQLHLLREIPLNPRGEVIYFYWTHGDTNHAYALERTPFLIPSNWETVPVGTNGTERDAFRVISVMRQFFPDGFYRLRVDPLPDPP
jgi:hypothetical protein